MLHIIEFYFATDNRVFTVFVMQLRRPKLRHDHCRLPRALDRTTTKRDFRWKSLEMKCYNKVHLIEHISLSHYLERIWCHAQTQVVFIVHSCDWLFRIRKSWFYILHFSINSLRYRSQRERHISSLVIFYPHLVSLEFADLRRHEIVEVRMEPIHWAIDAHRDIILTHFIQ